MTLPPCMLDCSTPQREYWSHVADQHELPIAPGRDLSRSMSLVDELALAIRDGDPEKVIAQHLASTPALLDEIRIFAGWSDKRLYLSLSYKFSRTILRNNKIQPSLYGHTEEPRTLCGCHPYDLVRHSTSFFKNLLANKNPAIRTQSAEVITKLLTEAGATDTLKAYSQLDKAARTALLKNLVFTKESQQNEAKRRGHGAESLIASVLTFSGCNFAPPDKVTNPMGSADPNIDTKTFRIIPRSVDNTMSCDIAALGPSSELRAWTVSLVQSSDPGQFGVDKSNTTTEIRRLLDIHNSSDTGPEIELWGIVDGVGYSENKSGTINRMLKSFHQFFQVKSAYKAALAAHALGIGHIDAILFDRSFYDDRTIEQMSRYIPTDVMVLSEEPSASPWHRLDAGKAAIFRDI